MPQLPRAIPAKGCSRSGSGALPEVEVGADGRAHRDRRVGRRAGVRAGPRDRTRATSRSSTRRRADPPPARVKAQVTGPLTLGTALVDAGMPPARAFRRAARWHAAWSVALEEVSRHAPARDRPAAVLRRARTVAVAARSMARSTAKRSRHALGRARGPRLRDGRPRLRRRRPRARARGRSRRSWGSRCVTTWCTTPCPSRASSTATVGSPGAPCAPTARSANPRSPTGVTSPRCGASSRGAAAIPCRCARAG